MTYVDIMGSGFRLAFEKEQLLPVDAIPTPLPQWNEWCRDDGGGVGIARGWFVVVGGNPKFGKSILALNMAASAMRAGEPVCFVSLEMTPKALAARFYAMLSMTPVWKLEKGGFTKEHFDKVWNEIKPLANDYDFIVNDTPIIHTNHVIEDLNDARDKGYSFFIIDYLQLMGLGDEAEVTRQVTTATTHLRHFALSTNSTVIVLSQFNRETSKNYDDTPQVQGLHGGMIIEASADQIYLLDHSRYAKVDSQTRSLARTWGVLTNRHGPHGEIMMQWDYDYLSVAQGEPGLQPMWPT